MYSFTLTFSASYPTIISDLKSIEQIKKDTMSIFKMSDIGLMHNLYIVEISQEKDVISVSFKTFTKDLRMKLRMYG